MQSKHLPWPSEILSTRQIEILHLMTEGYTSRAIGDKLGISRYTVRNHKSALYKKLKANSAEHAVAIAMRKGYVSRD
jgi:DNA-binding CsgD family transcriptional regulator